MGSRLAFFHHNLIRQARREPLFHHSNFIAFFKFIWNLQTNALILINKELHCQQYLQEHT